MLGFRHLKLSHHNERLSHPPHRCHTVVVASIAHSLDGILGTRYSVCIHSSIYCRHVLHEDKTYMMHIRLHRKYLGTYVVTPSSIRRTGLRPTKNHSPDRSRKRTAGYWRSIHCQYKYILTKPSILDVASYSSTYCTVCASQYPALLYLFLHKH